MRDTLWVDMMMTFAKYVRCQHRTLIVYATHGCQVLAVTNVGPSSP